ncbi:sporulation protein [Brevibacillus marinus]|uniref:sporulation protein n=1 Tax=Brevibacillus marinus TaxID=2496837 RepID=UPI000F83FB01|nr:sporulation protein [Brevibacillus marinus]
MLKKLMAKFGVGAATVDLRLDREQWRLGETMTGVIRIEGGEVEQRIHDLQVVLMMRAQVKGNYLTRPVQAIPVLSKFVVKPKPFVQEVPFQFTLPHDLAMSSHAVQYYLHTRLDVEQALDPTDQDFVALLPPLHIERVFTALERLDLRQKPGSGKLTAYGQEFSFVPARPLGIPLKELEVIFYDAPDQLHLLVELDLATGFLGREVERRAEIAVPHDLLAAGKEAELARYLREKIESYVHHPQTIPYFPLAGYGRKGYSGPHHSMSGLMGGMAAGLLGGILLSEMMDGDELTGGDDWFGGDGGDGGFFGGDGGGFGDFEL